MQICDMYDDGEDSKDTTKRKSRNASEKKRRDQFNVLIQELCSMVSTKTRKLDKSAVLRATIHFLKAHNDMVMKSEKNAINENWKPSFLSDDEFSQLMLEALDGFMIVFSQQGHILYTSDSVISLLRHLPKDLESCTIYELIHEDDRPEMFKILSRADPSNGTPDILGQRFSFSCHMRRGTLEPDKPAEYEPIRFNGSFSLLKTGQAAAFTDMVTTPRYCFVATVRLLSTQLSREMATFTEKGNEFTSRHSLDWKFLFLDHRAPPIIGYLPFEVLGTSVYEYYQQDDLDKLGRCHEALMQTGEGKSCYYRFLTKGQEWIWLQTRYFITYNQWNSKPEFIVCTHQVVNYADVRNDINKELVLTDSKMSGAESDSTNLWDSSASESASLSTSVSSNSSLNVPLFSTGKHDRWQSSSTDESVSCTSSLKAPSLSHTESRSGRLSPKSRSDESVSCTSSLKAPSISHTKSRSGRLSPKSESLASNPPQPPLPPLPPLPPPSLPPPSLPLPPLPQPFVAQPSPVPGTFPNNGPPQEQPAPSDSNLTPQQITVIQLKLQEQLMMRHHKLQDAILLQQQELQQVQQQLMMAQQLMMQHHPMLGQMFIQQQEQLMGSKTTPTEGSGQATPMSSGPATPMGSGQATPICSAQATPMMSGQVTPICTGQATPMGSGQATPICSGQAMPMGSGQATPIRSVQATPMGSAQATPIPSNPSVLQLELSRSQQPQHSSQHPQQQQQRTQHSTQHPQPPQQQTQHSTQHSQPQQQQAQHSSQHPQAQQQQQQPQHSSQHPQQQQQLLQQQIQQHKPQPASHETISMEQLVQHQLSAGAMWPCSTPNLLDLPSNALQSATRAPFAMHQTHQYPSTSGQSLHREHLTPHRTNNTAPPPPHQQVGPPGQQPTPHLPQVPLNCHSLAQPTMHSSMTMPPGAQAVPMQDLSCLGLPTLDMGSDQYMHQSEGQDNL
ncbi:circadian locomoter output cycles protein kaput isoform X1 [Strongylocentrotus purpuratus]|uniref:Circadian locomoter output cycles protein kaput n=1 Tax=Strongylocentrotus purpuratus TaxID=7668 RepID=A0A7M7NH30_STRPU|nr:circadian locomoter output cycles protein kaput isoform X1 [Strongylocentrotus purpuratus]